MPHRHHQQNGQKGDHHHRNHHRRDDRKVKPVGQHHEKRAEKPLRFQIVSISIPHPEKQYKHGEDASFIHRRAFGVYDGVGGWAEEGIDSGLYSKGLAKTTEKRFHDRLDDGKSITDALKYAVRNVRHKGSSTACTAELVGSHLKGVNVGDSGLIVVRKGKMEYSTIPQNKSFNHPHQVSYEDPSDLELGDPIDVHLREGDIIVAASDGLWDNTYRRNIVDIIQSHEKHWNQSDHNPRVPETQTATEKFENNLLHSKEQERYPEGRESIGGSRLRELSFDMARKACRIAHSSSAKSPFSDSCLAAGKPRSGGKLDDLTIVVAKVVKSSERYTASFEGTCPSCR